MAKLTRAQRADVEGALHHLERATRYVMNERTAVCRRDTHATTTLHYVRASDGASLVEVAKDIGSDLTGLDDAKRALYRLLGRS